MYVALTIGLAAVVGGAIFGATLTLRDGSPREAPIRELRIPLGQLTVDEPRQFSVEGLGRSPYGTPYPLWVVRDEAGVHALIGKDPHSGCAIPYQPGYDTTGFSGAELDNPIGAFKDGCGGWVYTRDGDVIFGAPYRGLDAFPAMVTGDTVVVRLDTVIVGRCRRPEYAAFPPVGCSNDGDLVTVHSLPPAIIPNWGHR